MLGNHAHVAGVERSAKRDKGLSGERAIPLLFLPGNRPLNGLHDLSPYQSSFHPRYKDKFGYCFAIQ